MNNEQKNETKRLPGFYIALCCCVLAIGVAGYFTERHEKNASKDVSAPVEVEDNVVISNNEITATPYVNAAAIPTGVPTDIPEAEATAEPDSVTTSNTAEYEEVMDYAYDNPDFQETAVIVNAEKMQMPVTGTIAEDYSEELKYNEALGDWRTHDGIDIICNEGCSVNAAADGIVESVEYDVYGFNVTIDHQNDCKTVYRQLENAENLKAGDTVKCGDVIGTIGASAGENVKEPHLHFEVYKNGECIDPKTMF